MSASVAGSSTPSPLRDWLLPMPQDIGIDDSFSNDLIRQFDKKRSRLRVEMMQQVKGTREEKRERGKAGWE